MTELSELHFEAPMGQRILRSRFMGIATFCAEDEPSLWWDGERWVHYNAPHEKPLTSRAPCRSYKAFLRHLKKHQEELRGYEVVLVSRYVGYSITAFLA